MADLNSYVTGCKLYTKRKQRRDQRDVEWVMAREGYGDAANAEVCRVRRHEASAVFLGIAHDPMLRQCKAAHESVTGPPEPAILQCPRTASSGRRLTIVTFGGSYGFLPSS